MNHQPANTDVDPQALASAQSLWKNFTCYMTYGVIAIALLLMFLAAVFV